MIKLSNRVRCSGLHSWVEIKQQQHAKQTLPERIYNYYYGNGVPAMFTS